MTTEYEMVFENQSNTPGSFCVFQTQSDQTGIWKSLVWFTKPTAPQSTVWFRWRDSYSFVWAYTGPLIPGAIFSAVQQQTAGTNWNNQITLKALGRSFTFSDPKGVDSTGVLSIIATDDLPPERLSVGIAMDGVPILATQAVPGTHLSIQPATTYWAAFGTWRRGEVLEAGLEQLVQIEYPPGITSMTVTYDSDGRWRIEPTNLMNANTERGTTDAS